VAVLGDSLSGAEFFFHFHVSSTFPAVNVVRRSKKKRGATPAEHVYYCRIHLVIPCLESSPTHWTFVAGGHPETRPSCSVDTGSGLCLLLLSFTCCFCLQLLLRPCHAPISPFRETIGRERVKGDQALDRKRQANRTGRGHATKGTPDSTQAPVEDGKSWTRSHSVTPRRHIR
jgi:hypothetical protein